MQNFNCATNPTEIIHAGSLRRRITELLRFQFAPWGMHSVSCHGIWRNGRLRRWSGLLERIQRSGGGLQCAVARERAGVSVALVRCKHRVLRHVRCEQSHLQQSRSIWWESNFNSEPSPNHSLWKYVRIWRHVDLSRVLGFQKNKTIVACCGYGGKHNYNPSVGCASSGEVKDPVTNLTTFVNISSACADPAQYLNWDGNHPTQALNRQVSLLFLKGRFVEGLPGSSNLSLLCNLNFTSFWETKMLLIRHCLKWWPNN